LTADVLVICFEEYAAAYEGTEAQYLGKGDVVASREYSHGLFRKDVGGLLVVVIPYRASLLVANAFGTVCKGKLVNV
jgi:hypothetical protein